MQFIEGAANIVESWEYGAAWLAWNVPLFTYLFLDFYDSIFSVYTGQTLNG